MGIEMFGTLFSSPKPATDFSRDREFPELAVRAAVKRRTADRPEIGARRTFADGFMAGWLSLVDPGVPVPEIAILPATPRISDYFQGLLSGIEAAKGYRVSLCDIRDIRGA
jgi:hypothetical protein